MREIFILFMLGGCYLVFSGGPFMDDRAQSFADSPFGSIWFLIVGAFIFLYFLGGFSNGK